MMPDFDFPGGFILTHPIKVNENMEICCLTNNPFPAHLYRPSHSKLGHKDAWQLIVPLNESQIVVNDQFEITVTPPHFSLYWLDGCKGHLNIIYDYAIDAYFKMAKEKS